MVVDASIALDWVLELEGSDYGEQTLAHVLEHGGVVPAIWCPEVANGLLVSLRRRRMGEAALPAALALLERVPLAVHESASRDGVRHLVHSSLATGLTAYDSAYLELALRESLPLATHDADLRKAAEKIGVALFARASS